MLVSVHHCRPFDPNRTAKIRRNIRDCRAMISVHILPCTERTTSKEKRPCANPELSPLVDRLLRQQKQNPISSPQTMDLTERHNLTMLTLMDLVPSPLQSSVLIAALESYPQSIRHTDHQRSREYLERIGSRRGRRESAEHWSLHF